MKARGMGYRIIGGQQKPGWLKDTAAQGYQAAKDI